MDLKVAAAFALVLVFAVWQAAALECHVSAAANEETPGTATVVTCNGSCAYGSPTMDGITVNMQACMPATFPDMCMALEGDDICYCNTDLCNVNGNSGTSGLGSLLVTWLLAASVIVGRLCYV